MTRAGFRTPCPPDVLLSAYDVGAGTLVDSKVGSGSPEQRVTGLVVLDGVACVTRTRTTPTGPGSPGELLVVDAVATPAVPQRLPLRSGPTGLAEVSAAGGGRLFLPARGGRVVIPIDLGRNGDPPRPGAAIPIGPAADPDGRSWRRASADTRWNIAASSAAQRVWVGDPHRRRIEAIDAQRLLPVPGEAIELPAAPVRLVVDEQGTTLIAALDGHARPELAVVDLITGAVDVLSLAAGVPARDVCYDNDSGLLFVGTRGAGPTPPGVLVLDRDTGRTVGEPIRTSGVPAALALLRTAGATLLFCVTTSIGASHVTAARATDTTTADRVEVIDVVHRAVVGIVAVPAGSAVIAVDEPAGNVFVAGSPTGAVTRLAPRVGGTPIARHPAIDCAGAGAPLGGPRRTPDGTGWLQPFCRGTAVATTDIGAVLIDADHADSWLASDTRLGPVATGVESVWAAHGDRDPDERLGNPVADTMTLAGRRVTYFERGLVATGPSPAQPIVVGGPVYLRYRELDDIAGPLGPPVGPATGGPDGAVLQSFAAGHVAQHPGCGTRVLQGNQPSAGRGCPERCGRDPFALDLVGAPAAGRGHTTTILLTGAARVLEVTDEGGRRLTREPDPGQRTSVSGVSGVSGVSAVATSGGRARDSGAEIPGLLRLARFPPVGAMPGGELFSAEGEHAGLRFDVGFELGAEGGAGVDGDSDAGDGPAAAGATPTEFDACAGRPAGYCWSAWMAGCAVRITAPAGAVPDRLTAEYLGMTHRGISVEVPRDGAAKCFAVTIQAAGGAHPRLPRVRRYAIDELLIVAGQRISFRIDDGGGQLLATNHGPPATAVMRIGADDQGRPPAPRRAVLAAGATTVFRPLDWTADGRPSRAVAVEVRDSPNGPARLWDELPAIRRRSP